MDENSTDPIPNTRFGNPDFFLITYLVMWGVDLAIPGPGPVGPGLLVGTPIAAIGVVVSFIRWRRLSPRQKLCLCLLLIVPVFAIGLFVPGL